MRISLHFSAHDLYHSLFCSQVDGHSIVSGHSQFFRPDSGDDPDDNQHQYGAFPNDDSSSDSDGDQHDASLGFSNSNSKKMKSAQQTAKEQREKLHRTLAKNRRRDLQKRDKTDADGFTVFMLRELYRNAGGNRNYYHVRLSEAFDRHFDVTTSSKTDMLNRDYPLLGSLIIDAYFAMHKMQFKHAERIRAHCLAWVYDHIIKWETIAVNDAIIAVCEQLRHAESNQFPELLFDIRLPSDQRLHSDSMLTSRAANVCVGFSMFGRCDSEKLGRDKCSGRHICITPLCRNRRAHCTVMCTAVNTINPMNLESGCEQRMRGSILMSQQNRINRDNRYQQPIQYAQQNRGSNRPYRNNGGNNGGNNGRRRNNRGRGRGRGSNNNNNNNN